MPHILSKFRKLAKINLRENAPFHVIVFLYDLYSVLSWSQSPCGRDETLYTLLIGSTKESVPMLLKIVWFVALRPVNSYDHVGTVNSPNQIFHTS